MQWREATTEEKVRWISGVSRGFTRGVFHDIPTEKLPLYHDGYDFYLIGTSPVKEKEAEQLVLPLE